MTLVDDNPTILEDDKNFMHVDHKESIVYDSYIVEFDYDPTCNNYERGKYGCRNLHVTKLPLVMLMLHMILKTYLSLMMNMLLIIKFAILLKVGLEEHQLLVIIIPLPWRVFNLMKFLIKVGLERT